MGNIPKIHDDADLYSVLSEIDNQALSATLSHF